MARKPYVEVEWVDSMVVENGLWIEEDEVEEHLSNETMRQISVGILVGENDEAVALATSTSTWDPEVATQRVGGVHVIPRGAILAIRHLRAGNTRSR